MSVNVAASDDEDWSPELVLDNYREKLIRDRVPSQQNNIYSISEVY